MQSGLAKFGFGSNKKPKTNEESEKSARVASPPKKQDASPQKKRDATPTKRDVTPKKSTKASVQSSPQKV